MGSVKDRSFRQKVTFMPCKRDGGRRGGGKRRPGGARGLRDLPVTASGRLSGSLLAMTSPAEDDVANGPAWFSAALADAPQERVTTAEGAAISYRVWGRPDDRGIVLVHGGGAHSRWWDHIGPLLAKGWRVAALDLSGHGDSGRRDSHTLDT